MQHVDVAVFGPFFQPFTYRWPAELGEPLAGIRVRIPFGNGSRHAIVVNADAAMPRDVECKAVIDRLDLQPLYGDARMQWLQRAQRYYLAAPGEMAETALAWAAADGKRQFRCADPERLAESDAELRSVFSSKRALSIQAIGRHLDSEGVHYRVIRAAGQGLLEEKKGDFRADSPLPHETRPVSLTAAQQAAVDTVLAGSDTFSPFLLFGATGSGKTEVYLQLAESLIARGMQVLILVPEIGLTPMWLARITARFERCAVWHSAMGDAERLAVRGSLADIDMLVGTRSALFLPLPRLGLVVVDEEHDGSFKQQEGVSYSARDLSLLLGQSLDVPVVLGSATPSMESWRQCREGQMTCLPLPDRIGGARHVAIERIDMRGHSEPLSPALIEALKANKANGEQAILFLNRRGYAPALQCTACGDVPECPDCSIRLTLHRKAGRLRCHMCGYQKRVPRVCSSCGEDALLPLGSGTEQLEDILHTTLPELRFARFDRDTVTSQKRLHEVLAAFAGGELDCLIGTQMLVKGHHFPNVTLVGVVNADLGMNLPDFRAGEHWWQQMTQVVGRGGRGEIPGRVLIQTWSPESMWLERIGDAKAAATLDEELALRQGLVFPPYARWVRIVFSATRQVKAEEAAMEFAAALARLEGIDVSGPMACAIERLAGRFRVELLLRDRSRKLLPWKLMPLLERIRIPSGVRRKADVDPLDMM